MARTKQTASKSVDGTAPRKAPSTTSLADTASKVQKTKAVTGRKQALQKASVRPYMLAAPKEGKKDSLCTGCQNGGEVICCDTCNGWLCYVVVQPRDDGLFVEDPAANGCLQVTSQKQAEELEFICPRCHCDKDAAFSTKTRYFGFLDKEKKPVEGVLVAVRRAGSIFFAPIKTPNTVLLFLALEGCETMDQPMIDAHSYLEPYFGRDGGVLKTFSVFFNFQKSGVDGYKRQLRDVVDAVSDAATSQVVVIFMTHIGEGGCLQHSPVVMNNKDEVIDEGGSFDPKELLPQLFVNELTQPLKDKLRSTLMFFVCGGIEGHTETRDWMLESVSKGVFGEIFSFPERSFQPSIARSFVGNYLVHSYIRRAPFPTVITTVLGASLFLGEASDVVLIACNPRKRGGIIALRFYWVQSSSAPFGETLPTMCPKCACLHTLKFEMVKESKDNGGMTYLRVTCNAETATGVCKFFERRDMTSGRIYGPSSKGGQWYSEPYPIPPY